MHEMHKAKMAKNQKQGKQRMKIWQRLHKDDDHKDDHDDDDDDDKDDDHNV